LLQERLVHESRLGVWVHPILIAVIVALAWPDAPTICCSGGLAPSCSPRCSGARGCSSPRTAGQRAGGAHRRARQRDAARHRLGIGGALVLPVVPFETTALILVVLAGIIASSLTTPPPIP